MKTNQQKENGRTSPSTNQISSETDLQASSPTLLQSQRSNIIEQIEQDTDSSVEQQSTFDLDNDNEIDATFVNNCERKVEDYLKTIDQSIEHQTIHSHRIRSISTTTIPTKSNANLLKRRKSTSNS